MNNMTKMLLPVTVLCIYCSGCVAYETPVYHRTPTYVTPATTTYVTEPAYVAPVTYSCRGLETIYFAGTRAQWEAIEKETDWDAYTGDYAVVCADDASTRYAVEKGREMGFIEPIYVDGGYRHHSVGRIPLHGKHGSGPRHHDNNPRISPRHNPAHGPHISNTPQHAASKAAAQNAKTARKAGAAQQHAIRKAGTRTLKP